MRRPLGAGTGGEVQVLPVQLDQAIDLLIRRLSGQATAATALLLKALVQQLHPHPLLQLPLWEQSEAGERWQQRKLQVAPLLLRMHRPHRLHLQRRLLLLPHGPLT